jgi:hypothetical protein
MSTMTHPRKDSQPSHSPGTLAQHSRESGRATACLHPSEEEIRLRAYEKYCARNGAAGDSASDWLEAERELVKLANHNRAHKH